ncbi:Type I transmembrane sorting receptor [Ptychographa xylographoides]|nr:Type I transmembrane sorting receptor [Ptychographa xylographoides]
MPSLKYILAIASFCYLSSAAPFKTGFTLKQIPRDTGLLLSGPRSLLKAYEKYGAQVPGVVRRAALTSIGSVTATPTEYDTEYLISVEISSPSPIGSAPQTFTMDVDTGSVTFSLANPKYGPPGATVTKTVDIGGATVTGQAITLNSDSSGNSNIVGLLYEGQTFYTNAVAQGLPQAVFTADLKKGAPGKYNFGYIDTSEYTGTITTVAVTTSNGFWEFTSTGYAVGTAAFVSLSIDSIVDTGTTLLLLPTATVKAYYAKVSGASNSADEGGYIFPCAATLPKFTLGIAAFRAVVPGSYINYAPVNNTYCFGGIQSNTGIGFSILGLTFIKSQFVVFSGTTKPTLGFAAKPT